MLKSGVLDDPKPDYFLAMHLWKNSLPGHIVVRPGRDGGSADIHRSAITGRGRTRRLPDPVRRSGCGSSSHVTALQNICLAQHFTLHSALSSVTEKCRLAQLQMIPSSAELMGTIRTLDGQVRVQVVEQFHRIINGVASGNGRNRRYSNQTGTQARCQ